jgi:hypothetical protein
MTKYSTTTMRNLGIKGPEKFFLLAEWLGAAPATEFNLPIESDDFTVVEAITVEKKVVRQISFDNVDDLVCLIVSDGERFGIVIVDQIELLVSMH